MLRKLTFAVGFGAGYVLGAKAGQQRYEQISVQVRQLLARPAEQQANGTASPATTAAADQVTSTTDDPAGAADDLTSTGTAAATPGYGSASGAAVDGAVLSVPAVSIDEMSELELELATRPTAPPPDATGSGVSSRTGTTRDPRRR